ncbi:MAG: chorismate-binding protein, partial [Microbacteriaceae bacterium]|nr:chorismate-binding protein [Microbacteriaceae bacterium]
MLLDGPTVFVRGGRGWIGEGPTTRGEFAGGGAFREAADWWRATMNARRATGQEGPIVAFAAFPFDAASPAGAILLVPASARAVDDAWIGEQGGSGARRPHAALLPGAMTRGDYQAAVAATSAAIRAGRLEKAVLARDVVAVPDEPVDLDALIARLVAAHPGASVFCVDGLVGASPETLLAVHGGVATARVLAGTAGREEAEALLESDKDRREHALAVRSVVEALAPHVRALQTTEPYVLEQPHLTHLATDVTAEVADGSDVLALVAALHPTAAVAGTPRAAALDLI